MVPPKGLRECGTVKRAMAAKFGNFYHRAFLSDKIKWWKEK